MQPSTTSNKTDLKLEIIAQPFYGSKLRYRSDFLNNRNRLNFLKSVSTSFNYPSPTIQVRRFALLLNTHDKTCLCHQIPLVYRNSDRSYFIRVCLVTAKYSGDNRHYIHPYILEDPKNPRCETILNDGIYYPIEHDDNAGMKR
jgi:hypothetical protein